jgi:hypothetical protein
MYYYTRKNGHKNLTMPKAIVATKHLMVDDVDRKF